MIFDKVEVEEIDDGYEVILHINPNPALEEFADEFGFTKKAEEDINRVAASYVKKKFPTLRVKTIKVMMGGALVTSIMFGGGMTQAFANEHEGEVHAETETVTDGATTETNTEAGVDTTTPEESPEPGAPAAEESSPTDEGTDTSPVEEEPETATGTTPEPEEPAAEEVPMDEPGLVPGDFFYFVEAIAEKVQLAMTFDDTGKAELISQFANERIAEANALFEAGDTDGAIALLNEALESQELALDYVTEEEGETTSPEEAGTTPEGDLPPEETEGEPAPTEDEVAVPDEEATDPASEVADELQTQFSQNITALLLAMEKVENPKAKAALAKNVEKAYAKMEKKLGKMKDIEERIATAIPVDEEVEDLRADIRSDQEDFENDMSEVEEQEGTSFVPPVAPKKAQEKAQKDQEKAQTGQQKAQEKASTGQEKQTEKRAVTPAPKYETKTSPTGEKTKGNTNAGGNGNGKAKVETNVNANVEAGEEVTPTPKGNERSKGNEGKRNQGKGNGKNNE
nr:DUF5667 domain-containing protein [Fredinandcohnia onubensis]